MKKSIAVGLLCAAAGLAQNKKVDTPASTQSGGMKVPAGAQQIEPYTWRYTDAQGKVWLYRQTPFGITRYADDATPAHGSVPGQTTGVAAGEVAIPKDAEQVDPYTYRQKDAQGKVWIYRKTPFGVKRYAEGDDAPPQGAPTANAAPTVKVKDLGDSYEFEQGTPFGPSRWKRKKNELSAEEQAMVNQSGSIAAPQRSR